MTFLFPVGRQKRTPFVLCLNFGGHTDPLGLWSVVFMVTLVRGGFNPVTRNQDHVAKQNPSINILNITG